MVQILLYLLADEILLEIKGGDGYKSGCLADVIGMLRDLKCMCSGGAARELITDLWKKILSK